MILIAIFSSADCASILELHRRFVALYRGGHLKIDVFSFVETALTLMSVLYLRIVGIDSAGKLTIAVIILHKLIGRLFNLKTRESVRFVASTWTIGRFANRAAATASSTPSWSR